jgi:hypothetical protein
MEQTSPSRGRKLAYIENSGVVFKQLAQVVIAEEPAALRTGQTHADVLQARAGSKEAH